MGLQSVSVEQPIPALADQAGLVSVLSKVAKGQSRNLQLALVAGVQAFFRTSGCRKGCAALACLRPHVVAACLRACLTR